jgi:hypothetical protein
LLTRDYSKASWKKCGKASAARTTTNLRISDANQFGSRHAVFCGMLLAVSQSRFRSLIAFTLKSCEKSNSHRQLKVGRIAQTGVYPNGTATLWNGLIFLQAAMSYESR